jgi:hypothetical protein
MYSKIRNAFGLAILLALMMILTVYAKGGFSFIAITRPGIDEEIRSKVPELRMDYFAFADFYNDKVDAPSDPGGGYQITRYYVEGVGEIPFDQLHYYPETGYVFYDGIVNGESEYDGEWYSANPAIRSAFESATGGEAAIKPQPAQPARENPPVQSAVSKEQSQWVRTVAPNQVIVSLTLLAGLAVLLFIALRLRKPVA